MTKSGELRQRILALVAEYAKEEWPERRFVPGETPVPVSGRVFDGDDLSHLVDSSLDFWLTAGRFAGQFERDFARRLGRRAALLCNSGSSANLLALTALTASELGERRLRPGDEVVTAAAGFPTTVAPIFQNGLVPVFLDIEPVTGNVRMDRLEEAIGPRTRAIMLAHTLGNPFDLDAATEVAQRRGLWLIEDNCDALGSFYRGRPTGTFGDLATFSFYPAHHITMGEGGAVATDQPLLKRLVESFRDWGRDCWCEPGKADTCGKRFDWQLGELPHGYDHKYTFTHLGYNLKVTDMQAAVGLAQLEKLEVFGRARRENWEFYRRALSGLEEFFILPDKTPGSDPSWFGFLLTVRPEAPFSRNDIVRELEAKKIQTRMLFAGNLVRQPGVLRFAEERREAGERTPYRVVGDLTTTDLVMKCSFWVGVYPGISPPMREFVVETIRSCIRAFASRRASTLRAPVA